MSIRKGGAGTGLNAGKLSAGAQLVTEPGADPEYAAEFQSERTTPPRPAAGTGGDHKDTLRRQVHLDEEHTP